MLRIAKGEWASDLSDEALYDLGVEVMGALAGVHKVDIAKVPYLGEPVPFDEDVTRWDRFLEKAADPEKLADQPVVRQKLLDNIPTDAPVGIYHGDFQVANLFCEQGAAPHLKAVIDWELTGVGATLNDVGWLCTFSDPQAWTGNRASNRMFLDPDTLMSLYADAYGKTLPDLNWFRALAAYKFAIISGFNLGLHRRGKRPDPTWEETALSMPFLMGRANELLG